MHRCRGKMAYKGKITKSLWSHIKATKNNVRPDFDMLFSIAGNAFSPHREVTKLCHLTKKLFEINRTQDLAMRSLSTNRPVLLEKHTLTGQFVS